MNKRQFLVWLNQFAENKLDLDDSEFFVEWHIYQKGRRDREREILKAIEKSKKEAR